MSSFQILIERFRVLTASDYQVMRSAVQAALWCISAWSFRRKTVPFCFDCSHPLSGIPHCYIPVNVDCTGAPVRFTIISFTSSAFTISCWFHSSPSTFYIHIVQFQKISIPPPPRMVNGNSEGEGGGGVIDGNFRGFGGCSYEEFLQRVRKFTKKSEATNKVDWHEFSVATAEK